MRTAWRIFILASVFIAVLNSFVRAAQDLQALSPEDKKAAYRGLVGAKLADPSLTSPVSPPSLDLQLTTEKKNKRAKAKIGLRIGDDFFFDTIFSAPLGDSETEVEPINLDGLAKSAVLEVGFHYLAWKPRLDPDQAREIQTEYLKRNPDERKFVLGLNNLKNEPDLRRQFLEAIIWKSAIFASLRAKVGIQGFTYVDSNFKEFSERKTSAGLEAAAGILFPSFGYLGFSAEAQRFFEGGESADLIVPYQGGPAQQIKKYVFGPPRPRDRSKVQLEYRKALGAIGAINPKVSYFPREKIALLELPVYVFKSPDEGLNGGFHLAWSSKSGGRFGAALFIGSAFSLAPK